jgi:hypothetical protein
VEHTGTKMQRVKQTAAARQATEAKRKKAESKRKRIEAMRATRVWADVLTIPETAAYLKRDTCTIYKEIREKAFAMDAIVRFGENARSIRIIKTKLDEWMMQGGAR